jgi:hypothetical protein
MLSVMKATASIPLICVRSSIFHSMTAAVANRFLVEVSTRMGHLSAEVAQQAREYLRTHDLLDTEFDQQISDYLKKNPIFTPSELARPELLGAPSIPVQATGTKEHADAWATSMGLHHGDPIRLPNGSYKFWKQGTPAQNQTTVQQSM